MSRSPVSWKDEKDASFAPLGECFISISPPSIYEVNGSWRIGIALPEALRQGGEEWFRFEVSDRDLEDYIVHYPSRIPAHQHRLFYRLVADVPRSIHRTG